MVAVVPSVALKFKLLLADRVPVPEMARVGAEKDKEPPVALTVPALVMVLDDPLMELKLKLAPDATLNSGD